ncbi:hypothetical protein C8R44DRAFT_725028 [Mycena epipterygia]|nr:hypothetical protein C8R44DRAFT_725028 [Mycena epipterygia]
MLIQISIPSLVLALLLSTSEVLAVPLEVRKTAYQLPVSHWTQDNGHHDVARAVSKSAKPPTPPKSTLPPTSTPHVSASKSVSPVLPSVVKSSSASRPLSSSTSPSSSSVSASGSRSATPSVVGSASSASGLAVSSGHSSASGSTITSAASSASQVPSGSISASVSVMSVSSGASSVPASSTASGSSISSSMSGSATSTASASPSGSACPVPKSTLSGRMNDASFSWCSGTGDSSVEIFSYGDDSTFQPDFSDIGTDSYTTFDASIPSDRVLRPRVPNLEWLGSGAVPTDRKKGCQADPDNCDNGGSGNCVLTTTDFDFDQSDMPTADASRKRFRVIRGNTTYRFLPGESMLARELVSRRLYQLVFNCDEMNPSSLPDVCNNMCYGMNCNKVVGPFMRETDKQKCKNNRKANECAKSVPNRCSAKYTGQDKVPGKANSVKMSCDEFPFASTDVASKPGIKTATQQGGRLGAFYRWELAANAQFTIAFDYGVGNFLSPGPKGPQENPFSAATTKMPYCLPKVGTAGTCDISKDPFQMT